MSRYMTGASHVRVQRSFIATGGSALKLVQMITRQAFITRSSHVRAQENFNVTRHFTRNGGQMAMPQKSTLKPNGAVRAQRSLIVMKCSTPKKMQTRM
ncbi:uncharacterized protein N7518_010136 [Penicillium psychrosexuale]|uniref:uncharacterized protein n=1 Tax=Penicillium psychrosexuale TaxID=1002107 RepID=UPI002544DAB2|nr:uncharacterized protein N7518_010136 [Penicillium psychrosexuale]KAJ5781653.1 hypothetical protein N7518_010136 [Penicillium psychrosexuale]